VLRILASFFSDKLVYVTVAEFDGLLSSDNDIPPVGMCYQSLLILWFYAIISPSPF